MEELLPGIHRVASAVSTVYLLIDDQSGITIIDTGPGHFGRVVLSYLNQIGRRVDEIQRILLTHRHFDHIGGARGLRDLSHARVWAHPLDAPQIDGREKNRMPKGPVGVMMGLALPLAFPYQPCPVDETLSEQHVFDLGGLGELQVVFTPGHTFGHCSFYLPSRRLLILGDALNNASGKPIISPDFLNDDTAQACQSVLNLPKLQADVLVFGHGKPIVQDGQAVLSETARRAEQELRKLEKAGS